MKIAGMTQIGLLLPSRETSMTGEHDAAGLVRFARAAEDAGFDSVWIGDSPLARTRVDPLPLLAAVAATTARVQLGTAALTATLRHPLLGAHTAATVDQLSNGRLVLGLGAGFPLPESRDEFAAVGVPFDQRVGRLDETVAIWRRSWSGGTEFDGRYWQLDDLTRTLPAATFAIRQERIGRTGHTWVRSLARGGQTGRWQASWRRTGPMVDPARCSGLP